MTKYGYSLLLSVNDSIVASSEPFWLMDTKYDPREIVYVSLTKLLPVIFGVLFLGYTLGSVIRGWIRRKSTAATTIFNNGYVIGGDVSQIL